MLDQLIYIDTDGDGWNETATWMDADGLHYGWDTNGDGNLDSQQVYSQFDEWGNPRHYEVMFDSDHNNIFDFFKSVDLDESGEATAVHQANDYNQDGNMDMVKSFRDTTGDGNFNTVTTFHFDNTDSEVVFNYDVQMDLTGNHNSDLSMKVQALDTNGDGNPDTVNISMAGSDGNYSETVTMNYEDYLSMNEMNYTTTLCSNDLSLPQFDLNTDPEVVTGDPYGDMDYWEFQGSTGRCAIYAQKFAIEAVLGREIPIEELVSIAEENGWFNEAQGTGTVSLNMDKLLYYYGVKHEMSFDNDIEALEKALNNGQKVIVSVDSGQIWYGDDNNIFSPETAADHAVEVIGIDHSDPNNPMVILNDSGSRNGRGEMVAVDVFENAWKAGDAQMITCWA